MPVRSLTKRALRSYLMHQPEAQRVAKFSALVDVALFKDLLKELQPEVLPDAAEQTEEQLESAQHRCILPPTAHYHQYRCKEENPLSCSQVAGSIGTACDQCYFPAWLPEKSQIVGKQGQYEIQHRIGRRGIGRLYAAQQLSSEIPVVIQEYLLPDRYFSPAEQRQYQDAFSSLAGLALADGRVQDLRFISPIEAINDPKGDRSYLILPDLDRTPTLNTVCAQKGAFTSEQITDMLNQVLQTLSFLHQQKFSLPSGQVQSGIIHGNISLDSLLWVERPSAERTGATHGYVYLTDFALWEKLFDPALSGQIQSEAQQDLRALGQVMFYLLNGKTQDDKGQRLNPRVNSDWPAEVYPPLKAFILQLLGIEPPFTTAEAARLALLALPPTPITSHSEDRLEEEAPARAPLYKRVMPLLLGSVTLVILGSLAWKSIRSRQPVPVEAVSRPCCIDAVDAIPTGEYSYGMLESAYWYIPFRAPAPTANPAAALSETDSSNSGWFEQLSAVYPELGFQTKVVPDRERAIAAIQSGAIDFTILPITAPLPPDIDATIVAYDSLVPVVAFSYPDRRQGLPEELNGRLSLEQLADIYDGTISNWSALNATDLTIKRYWIEDPNVQAIFSERILPTEQAFTSNQETSGSFWNRGPQSLPTLDMLRQVLQDFENSSLGSIGITPLSQAIGQCSVYPLALAESGQSVSPLIFENGKGVSPKSDLCDRKGSYFPNSSAIRSGEYPLAYPIAVVYPFDNTRSDIGKRIADLMLTQEGQQYLSTLGMVTAYPIED